MSSTDIKHKNRDNVIWFVVVIMMVINFGVLTYTTLYSDNNGLGTQAIETELNNLRFQINNAQEEIESLKEEIRISELPNDTPNLGFIELFSKTQNSVVLIETDSGTGSGWVYDNLGHIITNNHVVEDAATIQVTFQIGTVLPAKLIGRDPYSDMAVIKVKPVEGLLHPLEVGVSSELLVGEMVIAIGNPFGLDNTMTTGIVSATGRQMSTVNNYVIVDVIQTDAAINPGNSGGPLLNLRGEVVGMNTAIISNTNDFSGIGFAIPSDTVTREVESLIELGIYEHPWLGISGLDLVPDLAEAMGLDNNTRGTLVVEVREDGPAFSAGILPGNERVTIGGFPYEIGGDIIIGVDGTTMETFYELQVYLTRNTRPNTIVTMAIIRDGVVMDIPFTLGVRPPPS